MRPVLIDARPLQGDSASRGIGTYLRGLLDGMEEIGFVSRVSVLISRGAPEPADLTGRGLVVGARTPRLERRAQVLADPCLIARAVLLRTRSGTSASAEAFRRRDTGPRPARIPLTISLSFTDRTRTVGLASVTSIAAVSSTPRNRSTRRTVASFWLR